MNKGLTYIFLIILFFSRFTFSSGNVKTSENGFNFWKLKSLSGLLSLEGNYRSGTDDLSGYFNDERKSTLLTGKFELNTSNIFLHPNFLQLDANFSYSPVRNLDLYVISPDNSERNTTERVDLNGIFFSERIISLNPYFNFNHTFNRREYTTNIESFYTNYGTRLFSPNIILPFNINIAQNSWDENEFQTGRNFNSNQFLINTEFNKTINNYSNNRLNVDYYNYKRIYGVHSTIHNKLMNWSLNNSFNFLISGNFNSFISITNQTGSQPLKRFLVNETLRTDLTFGFKITGRYQYYKINQYLIESNQHDAEARLEHQLFESLRSHIAYNYVSVSQTFYDEKINRSEIGFDYVKRIPTGTLRLNYNYSLSHQNRDNLNSTINILNESILLSDGIAVLLNSPYVDRSSIVVKNSSMTIIYQEYFDYILIQRGSYFELERIPGGQIANGDVVFVSYKADQQPALNFDSGLNRYGASITLFNNFMELFFSGNKQNYSKASEMNSDYLRTLNQSIYGIKFSYQFIDAGAEFEDYQSNVSPYISSRYFLRLYSQAIDNLIITCSANYRIYELSNDNSKQNFADASMTLAYLLSSNSKLSFEGNYIFQEGRQINLNLGILKFEYVTNIRQIDISVGYENYSRRLLADKSKYSGVYTKITRRF